MPVAPLWSVVLPVKGGPKAKSRLAASPELALALALDCLEAATGCARIGRVVVVTCDPQVTLAVRAVTGQRGGRVDLLPEASPGSGLVAAVGDGVRAASPERPVAVLLPDTPAVRAEDLAEALDAVAGVLAAGAAMAAVPDAEARGTVLLAAARGADLVPAFGPESLAAHRRLGASVVELDLPRLRRDVDTSDHLEEALALGVGPHTRQVLQALGDGWAHSTRSPRQGCGVGTGARAF